MASLGTHRHTNSNSAYTKVNEVRHVGDPKTWTIVLDTSDVEPSMTPDFVIESAFFDMSCMRRAIIGATTDAGTRVAYYYLVKAFEYEACVLNHKYVASDTVEDDFWHGFLAVKLDDLTREEFEKLDEGEKPEFMPRANPPARDFYSAIRSSRSLPVGLSTTI